MFTRTACMALFTSIAALTPALSHAIDIEQRSLSTDTQAPTSESPAPTVRTAPSIAAPAIKAVPAPPHVSPASTAATAAVKAPALNKAATAAVNPAWDMFQQLESLQSTVSTLQGQVEEQQQITERLREDLRVRYTDLDQRVELLSQRAGNTTGAAADSNSNSPAAANKALGDDNTPVNTGGKSALSNPANNIPVPIVEATPKPVTSTVDATNTTASANTAVNPANPPTAAELERQKQAYLAAYQRFRSDGAPAAITAMQSFATQYPNSVFTANAYYWLGEFQLASEPANLKEAEVNFMRVVHDYATSPKAAAATYKLGTIADLRGERGVARRWMTDVIKHFATSPEARLAKTFLSENPATVAPASSKR